MVWLEIATKVITTIQNNQKQGAYWSFKFTLFDRLVVTIPWVILPFHHYYEFPFWHTCEFVKNFIFNIIRHKVNDTMSYKYFYE